MRKRARTDLCGGAISNGRLYRDKHDITAICTGNRRCRRRYYVISEAILADVRSALRVADAPSAKRRRPIDTYFDHQQNVRMAEIHRAPRSLPNGADVAPESTRLKLESRGGLVEAILIDRGEACGTLR
jgi:hypothetical protein